MHALDVLGDPVRRRLVELLADPTTADTGTVPAGELTRTVMAEFGISQPAVSNHLRVLRETGFATSERAGSRRLYALAPSALDDVEDWLTRHGRFWSPRLDALDTEVARGRRRRRDEGTTAPGTARDQEQS